MSTIFEVPCPECGRSMSVAGGDGLNCAACQRTYQSRMGHLFPVGEPPASSIAAPASRPAGVGPVVRIAQVAPLYEAVPPGAYGGTERVIAGLCDGLVAQGHEVTLFAPETSETAAKLEAYGEPLRTRFSAEELVNLAPHLHLEMFADVYRRSDEFDVVHSHLDIWTFPFTRLSDVPTVLTMHGRLDLDFLRDLLPRYGSVPLVSISDDQRRAVADLDLTWAATVYNGLDLSAYADVRPRLRRLPRLRRAASPRRRVRWRRSRSLVARAFRCGWPPRSTRWTRSTTSRRSSRTWGTASTSSARSTSCRSPTSTPARGPRCSPATGPSPSAW